MNCSLKCFCDFLEADTTAQRVAIVKRYKKNNSGPVKGMSTYYRPVLRLIKGKLSPTGTTDEKLKALREDCIRPNSTDRLNDARIAANTRVYKAFLSEFGQKQLMVMPSPRMQFNALPEVGVNLQPELYAQIDGTVMMWKFGMAKDTPGDHMIHVMLQLFGRASANKGLQIPLTQIKFLNTMTGKIYEETTRDSSIEEQVQSAAMTFAKIWSEVA